MGCDQSEGQRQTEKPVSEGTKRIGQWMSHDTISPSRRVMECCIR